MSGLTLAAAIAGLTSVILVLLLGQPRIFFSMSRDGLLPRAFSSVHPRFRTPHVATLLTGTFVAVFAAVASIDEMVDLTNIGTLFAFLIVAVGILVLRVREPRRPRPFRVPLGWTLPVLGIASCLYLIYYLPPTSWLRFAAWLNIGFAIYAGYGSRFSRLTGEATHAGRPDEHWARTARTGLLLALGGTSLLLVTRALDLVVQGARARALWTPGAAPPPAVLDLVAAAESWREPSLFLVLPLAVNGAVLCPLVIARAWKARDGGPEAGARKTLAGAVALAAAIAVYFGAVVAWRRP